MKLIITLEFVIYSYTIKYLWMWEQLINLVKEIDLSLEKVLDNCDEVMSMLPRPHSHSTIIEIF